MPKRIWEPPKDTAPRVIWKFVCPVCRNKVSFYAQTDADWSFVAQRLTVRCSCGAHITIPAHCGTITPNGCDAEIAAEGYIRPVEG